jgi:hypothetical protein
VADILDTLRGLDRAWQAVLGSGLAVLTAASTTIVLQRTDPASAQTRVVVARLAQVYLPDGSNHPAVEGEVLPRGAELHTGRDGGAQLSTAGRRVFLDGLSTLRVEDGVSETLSRGNAMIDSRNGARLDLSTPAGVVATPEGAVTRVEEGLLTRIGVYDGTVSLRPVGRASSTPIEALHQVKLQPQSLPQRTTPLQLRDDSWDKQVAADLVSADEDLNNLADGLALQEGASYLQTVPVAFRPGGIPAPGAARGEEALTVAVAQAAKLPPDVDALAQVRADRADLGSWGVVAALAQAAVTDVNAVLSAALSPPGPASNASQPTVNAGPGVQTPGVQPSGTPVSGPSGGPSGPPTSRPTATPSVTPTPSPSSTVGGLISGVLAAVSPSPSAFRAPGEPAASPTPQQPCLLAALLC